MTASIIDSVAWRRIDLDPPRGQLERGRAPHGLRSCLLAWRSARSMPSARQGTGAGVAEKPGVDLRRLRYFLAVCDHGGFSRAAAAIGVAQPALTRQMKLLEKEIGLPLIERTRRGAHPSEQGRFLIARARQHLESVDGVIRDLRQAFTTTSGRVTLGVCPTIAPFFLNDLTEHICRYHPNVTLSIIQAHSGDLSNLMNSGHLDIALT
jgi:DNA-binding transcriptional LysR family regulator